MNVLVIDDNAPILEVLVDILNDAGHKVDTAGSENDAISLVTKSHPDLVFLDMDMNDGAARNIVERLQEMSTAVNVIVLRSWDEQIPRDSTVIKGSIQKPFKSSEVIEKIEALMPEDEDHKKPAVEKKEDESEFKATGKRSISFGNSYVMFQNDVRTVNSIVYSLGKEGYDVLLVTSGKKKMMKERFGMANIDIHLMSLKLLGGHFDIYRMGTMIEVVKNFVHEKEMPCIVFENINPMIKRNGMNSAIIAIHQVVTSDYNKKTLFMVCVDVKDFTEKDKEILLNYMEYYHPIEE
jgi:Response regulator containing CheY-like receiver, AAA-type ATPase, and DNA-binding domains